MNISDKVKRLLWCKSGGFCQNQCCNIELFQFFESGRISSIEELAHIIAQSDGGPRGNADIAPAMRDEYENIIILCPNCHTIIDKNPFEYPVELLREWKFNHERLINERFIVPSYGTRAELSKEVHRLLRINRKIFDTYGPHSETSNNPLTDAAKMWTRLVLSEIIPNNKRIGKLLMLNDHLIRANEQAIIDQFLIHQEGFEYNHISGDKISTVPLFPMEMNDILKEE
jgi:hypothetical protein